MTQPTIIELAPAQPPVLTRMVSNAPFSDQDPEPVIWQLGKTHPLVSTMKIVRMFVGDVGVEIYSVSDDGKDGMRNVVPIGFVRLIEEAMPLDVFAEELTDAEAAAQGEDDDDPDDPEPELEPAPEEVRSNGQVTP